MPQQERVQSFGCRCWFSSRVPHKFDNLVSWLAWCHFATWVLIAANNVSACICRQNCESLSDEFFSRRTGVYGLHAGKRAWVRPAVWRLLGHNLTENRNANDRWRVKCLSSAVRKALYTVVYRRSFLAARSGNDVPIDAETFVEQLHTDA